MSMRKELNLIASQPSDIINSYDDYLKLIENMFTNLKEDYNLEKVVSLCRKKAEKRKFSYHFKVDYTDYYPLSSGAIENWIRELVEKLKGPGYKFNVIYYYEDLIKIVVVINWV